MRCFIKLVKNFSNSQTYFHLFFPKPNKLFLYCHFSSCLHILSIPQIPNHNPCSFVIQIPLLPIDRSIHRQIMKRQRTICGLPQQCICVCVCLCVCVHARKCAFLSCQIFQVFFPMSVTQSGNRDIQNRWEEVHKINFVFKGIIFIHLSPIFICF